MESKYFFNTYDYQPAYGFDTRDKQARDAGVETEVCQMFGYGYYDCENPPSPTPPSTPRYLTFTATKLGKPGFFSLQIVNGTSNDIDIEYSLDGGETWAEYGFTKGEGERITLSNIGDTVMFRGENEMLSGDKQNVAFSSRSGGFARASGDVTSLLNGVGGDCPLYSDCFRGLFADCTWLETAPELPSMTLANNCYSGMFESCTSLVNAPNLPATTLAADCYSGMFNMCENITSYHVAAMNTSTYVFTKNSSCGSFTIDAVTPPEIGETTIAGLAKACIIYVPADSVDAYKAAQYWLDRAAYIQAKPSE